MLDRFLLPPLEKPLRTVREKFAQGGMTDGKLLAGALACGGAACFLGGMQIYPIALVFGLVTLAALFLSDRSRENNSLRSSFLAPYAAFLFTGFFTFLFTLGLMHSMTAATFLVLSLLASCGARIAQIMTHSRRFDFSGYGELMILVVASCLFPQVFGAIAIIFGFLFLTGAGIQAFIVTKKMGGGASSPENPEG
ncbi:MAG: hypothetical protein WC989_06575 [Micavibrio sp.]